MTLSYRTEGGKDKNHLCSSDRQQGEPEPGTHQPVYLLAGRVSAGEKAIIAAGGQRVCGGTSITLYGNPTQFEAEAYGSPLSRMMWREDNNQKVSADFSEQEIKTIICSTVCSS